MGQQVDQLLDGARVLREELPVLGHEALERLVGVLPAGVRLEQVVEVGQHPLDPLPVGIGGVLQRLLHPREALVEEFATEQVLDPLVILAGLRRAPRVVRQRRDRRSSRCGQARQAHLGEAGVVVEVAGQLLALGEQRTVQQLPDLLEGAIQPVPVEQFPAAPLHLAGQVVETALFAAAAAQELPHRRRGRVPGHHVLADRLEGLGEVDRGREGVAAGVAAVAGVREPVCRHWYTVCPSTCSLPTLRARYSPSRANSIAPARSPSVVAPSRSVICS